MVPSTAPFVAAVAVAGLVLAGCGEDVCTGASACPVGPSETPSQEHWRLTSSATLTLFNDTLDDRDDVPLRTSDVDLSLGGPEETCDTTTDAACEEIAVVLAMRLPTVEHKEPETGELRFVTKNPVITVFGTMSLDEGSSSENVYRAATLDVRTCSSLQSSPPDGPFRGQGHQVRWTSQFEFRAFREGAGGTLSFSGMPLTFTSNAESCEPFSLDLSGNLELER
jgi:hypothetical protein